MSELDNYQKAMEKLNEAQSVMSNAIKGTDEEEFNKAKIAFDEAVIAYNEAIEKFKTRPNYSYGGRKRKSNRNKKSKKSRKSRKSRK